MQLVRTYWYEKCNPKFCIEMFLKKDIRLYLQGTIADLFFFITRFHFSQLFVLCRYLQQGCHRQGKSLTSRTEETKKTIKVSLFSILAFFRKFLHLDKVLINFP